MNHVSSLCFYVTITATLLLAISLSVTAKDSKTTIRKYEQLNTPEECKPARATHTVKVHSKCQVTVKSRKCRGYCRSITDFQLEPPYLTKQCSCCKSLDKVTYKVFEHNCFVIKNGKEQYTGEKVKIAVPHDMKCQCLRCSRIL